MSLSCGWRICDTEHELTSQSHFRDLVCRRTIKCLLLGSGESGESPFLALRAAYAERRRHDTFLAHRQIHRPPPIQARRWRSSHAPRSPRLPRDHLLQRRSIYGGGGGAARRARPYPATGCEASRCAFCLSRRPSRGDGPGWRLVRGDAGWVDRAVEDRRGQDGRKQVAPLPAQ